ncbi:MAG: AAA family ATPase [Candidatus Chryseobacterium colombiense]|nr:AAA family ATPase [Chryseobacterium sp.]WEK70972.1 MAG: AAA family ATPase [Chryseobacterium sp.]
MDNKFDIIFSEEKDYESYFNDIDEKLERLKDLSNINILVGANNSGKSRFIRNFLKCKTCFYENRYYMQSIILKYNSIINENKFGAHNIHRNVKYQKYQNANGEILFKDLIYSYNQFEMLKLIDFNLEILEVLSGNESVNLSLVFRRDNYTRLLGDYKVMIYNLLNELKSMIHYNFIENKKQVFIPTLRTAHSLFIKKSDSFSKLSDDIFKNTIIKNYEFDPKKIEVFTGLDLYCQIVNIRNDIKDKRESFEKFEQFLSKYFFQDKKIEIVAKFNIYDKHDGKDDSEIINVYIDGESKDLHELGDGIQALFILMYKIYTCENESLIFIDEPEINLHPGMQRLFLEQITTNEFLKEKKLIYFISTHSNHFLDLTIEKENISIFLFNKIDKDKFVVKNVNHGDNSALQYLGVTNSSVFLANCSIWVEGISDRNYLKAFLKAYCRDVSNKTYPKEDIEFAFIEYAGSNIDHYNFDEEVLKEKINAFSINNKIFLISDYDGEYRNKKHEIYEAIAKENENFEYYTTKDYKEVENILPFKVWDKILIHFCNKTKVKTDEDVERIQKQISDSLSRKKEETYKDAYIGKLLKNIKSNAPELNKIWNKAEGTIINKAEVSYKVLELTEKGEITWEDFKKNPKIVSIIESLYDFIQKSNNK